MDDHNHKKDDHDEDTVLDFGKRKSRRSTKKRAVVYNELSEDEQDIDMTDSLPKKHVSSPNLKKERTKNTKKVMKKLMEDSDEEIVPEIPDAKPMMKETIKISAKLAKAEPTVQTEQWQAHQTDNDNSMSQSKSPVASPRKNGAASIEQQIGSSQSQTQDQNKPVSS